MAFNVDFRPENFDEVFGNDEIKETLIKLLEKKNKPHSYLFHGQPGCGKTTLARILAKELGCNIKFDFVELDTAAFRGIDTAREIRQQVIYKPIKGKAKVYFLDECHRLTPDAQEALLKVVEQPPEHVYFIFSTTEPGSLKKTLKDRCQIFEVKPLDYKTTVKFVKYVCKKLNESLPSKSVLKKLYEVSEGRPRQILVLLEKILTTDDEEEQLSLLTVEEEIEVAVIDLCRKLIKGANWKEISGILKNLDEEPEKIRRIILGYFNSVLLNNGNPRVAEMMSYFIDPFFNSGKPGLTLACFYACHVE